MGPIKTRETVLVMYGSVTMVWTKEERSLIRVVKMDNLKDLLGIRIIYRIQKCMGWELV